MLAELVPWLELALRWIHVLTAIAWIGASFYFIWLDGNLRPTKGETAVAGELWAVHGGGFYHNQKYLVAPTKLPPDLHWFKYEAYFTWISGFLLLAVMYYAGASIFLIDQAKVALTPAQAIAISLAFLAGGWIVYDILCRSSLGQKTSIFALIWFGVLTAAAYALTRIFSDRAAFLQVGAIIGTAMTANVFFVIIPNQKKVVASMLNNRIPDARLGIQAKQRSLHNNYMTLPVILCMISNHFPMLFGSALNWLALSILSAAAISIRHFFNLRHKGKYEWWLIAFSVVLFVIAIIVANRRNEPAAPHSMVSMATVSPRVRTLLNKHCVMCHSAKPIHEGFSAPPAGLDFTRDDVVLANTPRIISQAVKLKIMPLGNETKMTEADRATLGAGLSNRTK